MHLFQSKILFELYSSKPLLLEKFCQSFQIQPDRHKNYKTQHRKSVQHKYNHLLANNYIVPSALVFISRVAQANDEPRSVFHFCSIIVCRHWRRNWAPCYKWTLCYVSRTIQFARVDYRKAWGRCCIQHWPTLKWKVQWMIKKSFIRKFRSL